MQWYCDIFRSSKHQQFVLFSEQTFPHSEGLGWTGAGAGAGAGRKAWAGAGAGGWCRWLDGRL